MKKISTIFILTLILVYVGAAAPVDTKFIQWSQPNSTTFTARFWGDEFLWRMETQDGYRIIKGAGGWYYYATLNIEIVPDLVDI